MAGEEGKTKDYRRSVGLVQYVRLYVSIGGYYDGHIWTAKCVHIIE